MADLLLVEVRDHIATVTLNRPEARNALNRALLRRLHEVMGELDADAAVEAVILTGADPAFCAGVDLKELGAGAGDLVLPDAGGRRGPFPQMTTPVIGAVNGAAVTGGLELALACDFLVASDLARFADTHARVGVHPGWGLTVLLPEAVGLRRAREMSVTGNYIDADTALAWGLVNHVVPHEELLWTCRSLAADITTCDAGTVAAILGTYRAVSDVTAGEGWRIEADASRAWSAEHLDPAEVERRRAGVVARGRSQIDGR
ncbi:MAG: enoyl-CoA hydratase [Acidimicrobiales bacterium]|jgi:enoyl-CoA hydratase|nr:enoyl-CoA hydratase [Acidimicrobiales bacterium]